jgi:adenylate kinase family enzyme
MNLFHNADHRLGLSRQKRFTMIENTAGRTPEMRKLALVSTPRTDQPARILVYGVTGSGKSTFAERIGRRLELPWHSIDDLTWEPGWAEVPTEIQRARIATVCREPQWVLDAGYQKWMDIPLESVDLVVGLDYPRWLSFGRLLRRSVLRAVLRTPICNGNRESLRRLLSADSMLRWHFGSFARKRRRMRAWQADPLGPPVRLFRSPRAANQWLAQTAAARAAQGPIESP